jgi:hypothetical protein
MIDLTSVTKDVKESVKPRKDNTNMTAPPLRLEKLPLDHLRGSSIRKGASKFSAGEPHWKYRC